jgi:uncharacterized lipoprotein YajG
VKELKVVVILAATLMLSGCIGTAITVASSVAAAGLVGCEQAKQSRSANQTVVGDVCGSMFK